MFGGFSSEIFRRQPFRALKPLRAGDRSTLLFDFVFHLRAHGDFLNYHLGVRTIFWTDLCCDSEVLAILQGASATKRELDAVLVVPADIGIHLPHELLNCG